MEIILNVLFIIFFPLFFTGMINRVKSVWSGRQGPPVLQPINDFIKLMKKGEVISTTTSFVFRMSPSVTLASIMTAALLTPMIGGRSFFSFQADFVLFAYVLSAGKFFAIAGAMDTGSSFEGMGASREAFFSTLAEPAFFLLAGSLAFAGKTASFAGLLSISGPDAEIRAIIIALGAIVLFIMLLTEGYRVPVDDPNTHLELTMIHEVMILDNSGPDMGLILYASALKMTLIGSLIANLILPDLPLSTALPAFLGIFAALSVLIGTIESLIARLRMSHIPQFILFMGSIAMVVFAVILLFVSGGLK